MREGLKIVGLAVAAAVGYGIAHDLVTAHVCVEHFTIGHRDVFPAGRAPPAAYALYWGVVATWWVGPPLGAILGASARLGTRPQRTARDLAGPLLRMMLWVGAAAAVVGLGFYLAVGRHNFHMPYPMFERIPKDRHGAFFAVALAHNTSYLAGTLGCLILAIRTFVRRRPSQETPSGQ